MLKAMREWGYLVAFWFMGLAIMVLIAAAATAATFWSIPETLVHPEFLKGLGRLMLFVSLFGGTLSYLGFLMDMDDK